MSQPVGEDAWLARVDEASRTAGDIEQRVNVLELYETALRAVPFSVKLWLARCEWAWSLHTDSQNGDAGWSEEEQMLGQELFSEAMVLNLWQDASRATRYRLNDSHELWNRWISVELELLSKAPNEEGIERVRGLFLERLQTPHVTWDETSTMFSTFITKYDEENYESTMVQTTKIAKPAKEIYNHQREMYELKVKRATDSGDEEAVKSILKDYVEWESRQIESGNEQPRQKGRKGVAKTPPILCVTLYERAISSPLGAEATFWEDYIVFLSTIKRDPRFPQTPDVLSVLQRATSHCPWSGALWARYILQAEAEHLPFEDMERIKHAATDNRELDRDGMESVVDFYIAWVGFLKRRTMVQGATDEDVDIAEMGLPTALEAVLEWGKKFEWQGDYRFRIQKIFIQYLTQKGSFDEARAYWKKLMTTRRFSYEFWQQYYSWEMNIRGPSSSPTTATFVLVQALEERHLQNLDYPEPLLEMYIQHCNNFENVDAVLKAMGTVHRLSKQVAQRREREAAEAAAVYAQQQPQAATETAGEIDSPSSASKRKRDSTTEEVDGTSHKRVKSAPEQVSIPNPQELKRDREHTTILVTNLPIDGTSTRFRQYFKPFGHIEKITVKPEENNLSKAALIEFREQKEAESALLRDGKNFDPNNPDSSISVELAAPILWVTNYPDTWQGNDIEIENIFQDCGKIFDIRWPSQKHGARRYCYVTFRTADGAAAAAKLDGQELSGGTNLVAKYSDVSNKKQKEGAAYEGREVHITGVAYDVTEDELHGVFSQYGKVEKTRILNKGLAYVSFETKEAATVALEMNNKMLKSGILLVQLTKGKKLKPTGGASIKHRRASATPDADGDSAMSPAPSADGNRLSRQDPAVARRITLMNVPDTISIGRLQAIAEPYGQIDKLNLRPDHGGAVIEYTDAAGAGRALMGLQDYEIIPGRRLRTGDMKALYAQSEEIKTDRIQVGGGKKGAPPPAFLTPTAPIRRPGGSGVKGGIGSKKGLGFSAANRTPLPTTAAAPSVSNGTSTADANKPQPKSNSDFRNMFVNGGT